MAQKFWVGGGSANTWAATANTNWALTSGGANNAAIPGVGDVAVFDSNSGVGNSVIGASIAVQGVDCTGGTGTYAGTITHNTSVTLTINTGAATSLRFTSGMTYTPASTSSLVTFTNTTGTAQITSAGKTFAGVTVNGAGGTVQQQDALIINAVTNAALTLTTGIFDCNSQSLTASQISGSNSNTRSFLLGSGVTVGGNVTNNTLVWQFGTVTGLTFTKSSANVTVLSTTSAIETVTFGGGGLTYNGLVVNSTTNQCLLALTGANTFSSFSLGSGWSLSLPGATTTTISSAFTWAGTKTLPMLIITSNTSGVSTISVPSGTNTLQWGGLFGVTASGGATFTATNTFNFGTNTGWSVSQPADATLTPALIATAVWQDTTSGDFTTAGSIGKDLFVGGIAPGAAGGHFIAGTNAATAITTALTANVTGNITGNLSGSVGSVTARVTANSDQIAGSATSATNLSGNTLDTTTGVVGSGSTTTSIVTSSMTPPGSVANQFGSNVNPRYLIFDSATTTAALRNQATVVSASTNAAAPVLTINALTTAPVSTDSFRMP